jgi:NADPH:quinone reductase-like Zn-dependent oxidoreductase
MDAIVIDKLGESGALRERPQEAAGSGELLVRIDVAGVNPIDWKVRDGKVGERPMPLVLGQDFAGVVTAIGPDVRDFAVGDRVFGVARSHGAYAQFTRIPVASKEEPVGKIPDGLDDAIAAALPTPGLTAMGAIELLAPSAGTTIVIHGATGAVGATATQLAHKRGAHVIGSVKSSPDDARKLGADDVIDTSHDDVIAAIKREHPDGVDAVLDLVSSDRASAMRFADVLRPGGAIVSTNHMLDVDELQKRGFAATNIVMTETPQSSRQGLEQLAGMVVDGSITVAVNQERPLADAPAILDETRDGKLSGKTVLRVAPSTN